MSTLQHKIDFTAIISVNKANPNGDPLNGNRPRTTYQGLGEISDVCIKRKIRNRLQDMGECIFVQSDERADDGKKSLSERSGLISAPTNEEYGRLACEKWIDVRSFGQVFAFKNKETEKKGTGVSISVRGPVSVHQAVSVSPIDINSIQITKSVNSEPSDKKSSDTMGSKHMVEFGLYIIKGSINVQLAEKTGFSEDDAEKIKEALRTLFENDASAARPDGSMEVYQLYWWQHASKTGQYSSAKVHRSLEVKPKDEAKIPESIDDYAIVLHPLEGLEPAIIAGI